MHSGGVRWPIPRGHDDVKWAPLARLGPAPSRVGDVIPDRPGQEDDPGVLVEVDAYSAL